MKSDDRDFTGPDISFEMPAHEMCTERRAVLRRADGQSEWMTFAIDFMPDVIRIDGRRFRYQGVSDGRGFYREVSSPSERYWGQDMIGDDTPLEELKAEWAGNDLQSQSQSQCSPENGCGFQSEPQSEPSEPHTSVSPRNDMPCSREVSGSNHSADCELVVHCHHPESTCTCRSQFSICTCARPGRITDDILPYSRSIAPYGMHGFLADRDCLTCFGSGRVVNLSHAAVLDCPDPMQGSAENAPFNPDMQCSRCSELLDLVSQMIENPPGLSGIHCHLGHMGNHYVDAEWVEALTRVKMYLVTGGPGTRKAI